jgi:hypothetical protein
MNMANTNYQEHEFDYQVEFRRSAKEKESRKSRFQYARSNRPVVSHNGIHRRRNKRFAW